MRILLINPPYPLSEFPSLTTGLSSIAAVLLKEGHVIEILDLLLQSFTEEKIKKSLKCFSPDAVGITSVTMNFPLTREILRICKAYDPELVTIMGGPHVSFAVEESFREASELDIIVRKEGEETIVGLMDVLERGKDPKSVRGIAFRNEGEIVQTEDAPFIEDLDALPFPARHLLPLSKYLALHGRASVLSSRGCPYGCVFCVGHRMIGRRGRFRNPASVVDEMETLARWGFRSICIDDDLFTLNHRHATAICDEIIARGLEIIWHVFARVDTVNRKLLETMRSAGCTSLCYGIESGSQMVLDLIKKRITIDQARKAVELAKDVGMDLIASFIIGLPGETRETLLETVSFAQSLGCRFGYHLLAPFPGTDVRNMASDYGLNILHSDWALYDANRVIAETEEVKASDLTKVIQTYDEELKKYCAYQEKLAKRGEASKEVVEEIAERKRMKFVWDLLKGDYIERYGKIRKNRPFTGTKDFQLELIKRIHNQLPYPIEIVEEGLGGIINKGLIECRIDAEEGVWKWSSLS